MLAVNTNVPGLGEHPAPAHSDLENITGSVSESCEGKIRRLKVAEKTYLKTYEPSAADVVHEYLRVVDGLVQGPPVANSDLFVLACDVGVGEVHSTKVVTPYQHLVTS